MSQIACQGCAAVRTGKIGLRSEQRPRGPTPGGHPSLLVHSAAQRLGRCPAVLPSVEGLAIYSILCSGEGLLQRSRGCTQPPPAGLS
jgi:hypothetical protein